MRGVLGGKRGCCQAGTAHTCVPLDLCVHPPVPPPTADRLVPPLLMAAAQGLNCHQCKGFGGCTHASRCPWGSNYCVSIATRVPFSVADLPLVTKSCYSGCPDISTLGLGPHVSIVCCQFSLCNTD
ncbi:secreted Ly-6/uPAR domain-containing protein 2 isoform X1 [Mustela putorius furo]|uniref:Secreted Ly-6/uPAR domain-containing protein 2 n=1 Tax=Mustela putorius furo TaxID=9669 RepID=M3XSN4_MUSPF|nr:secreted Ly-6/uPAR domain-containing protein 2 isoform X1 [Mustela putorius furo]